MNPPFILSGCRPEIQLLLAAGRTEPDAPRLAALLAQPLDWPALSELANRRGLLPLLYRSLNRVDDGRVPAAVLAQLKAQYQANARRNIAFTRELLRLLARLEQHGIPALPYKGPALAVAAYGDLALRQFTDLDILVRPEDTGRAKALLEAAGYRFSGGLTPGQTALYAASTNHHHFALQRPAGHITVELHWHIAPAIFVPAAKSAPLWQRQTTLRLPGAVIPTFDPVDLLLLLAMHGGKHGWDRLGLVADLAELLRRQAGRFDPAELLARAKQTQQTRRLRLALWLAHHLLAAPLPDLLRPTPAEDAATARLAARPLAHLLGQIEWPPGSLSRLRWQQQLFDRRLDRWRYPLELLTAPTLIEWSQQALPARLNGLYRLWRPLRLARKYLVGSGSRE